ncbi:MAG: Maf family protein [Candidatus Levyibacteriota bacterium]
MRNIILASASPRRKQILTQVGIPFEVKVSNVDENIPEENPQKLAEKLSRLKAEDVARKNPDSIILAADTVVVFDGGILGKPGNATEAMHMLKALSGKRHEVITAFTIMHGSKTITKSEQSSVWFRELTAKEIEAYVVTGEPLDKAGGYGVQEKGAVFIRRIEGDYYNVVGLPICAVVQELEKLGLYVF